MNKWKALKDYYLRFLSLLCSGLLFLSCVSNASEGSASEEVSSVDSAVSADTDFQDTENPSLPVPVLNNDTEEAEDDLPAEPSLSLPVPETGSSDTELNENNSGNPEAVLLQETVIDTKNADSPKVTEEIEKQGSVRTASRGEVPLSSENVSETEIRGVPFPVPRERAADRKTIIPKEASAVPDAAISAGTAKLDLQKNGSSAEAVYARTGDEISYPFSGKGWIYTGVQPDSGIVKFLGKNNDLADSITFSFKAVGLGECELEFSRYNLTDGTEEMVTVPLYILSDDDFAALISTESLTDNSAVESMLAGEEYDRIIDYFKANGPQSPRETYILGISKERTGDLDGAVKIFGQLLAEEDEYRKLAFGKLSDIALETDNHRLLLGLMKYPDFFDIEYSPEKLLQMGKLSFDAEQNDTGIQALTLLRTRYGGYRGMDEVLWFLANLLERPGMYRDMAEALRLYGLILDGYPTSKYYEPSENRIRYLKRHYINVN